MPPFAAAGWCASATSRIVHGGGDADLPEAHRRQQLLIVTNGGGAGVLAVDDLIALGRSASRQLDDALKTQLDAMLPANWSRANPIDIIGDATPDRYAAVMGAVLARDKDQPILVINCPTALASSSEAARR